MTKTTSYRAKTLKAIAKYRAKTPAKIPTRRSIRIASQKNPCTSDSDDDLFTDDDNCSFFSEDDDDAPPMVTGEYSAEPSKVCKATGKYQQFYPTFCRCARA